MKNSIEKTLVYGVVIASIIVIVVYNYDFRINRTKVENNYFMSTGYIIKYNCMGGMESCYMTYEYKKDYQIFERRVGCTGYFSKCQYDLSICSDKRFWVAYEKGNPSNSLINLDIEIQDIENPTPPETLEGFR
ncbi:MAG: hypothetical protein ABJN36_12450 [Cyclobacteriaceae bacterium]